MKIRSGAKNSISLVFMASALFSVPVGAVEPCRSLDSIAPISQAALADIEEITHLTLTPTVDASTDQSAEVQACIAKVKSEIINRMSFSVLKSSGFNGDVMKINAVLNKGAITSSEYTRKSNRSRQTEGLALNRTFELATTSGNSIKVRLGYQLSLNTNPNQETLVTANITAEIYENGKLTGITEQVSSFDQGCDSHLNTHSATTFLYQGDHVKLTQIKESADGGTEKNEKTIAKSLIDGKIKTDRYPFTAPFPDHESIDAFMSFEASNIHYEIDRMPASNKAKSSEEKFKKLDFYRVIAKQGKDPIFVSTFGVSSISNYAISESALVAAPEVPQIEEVISEENWKKTGLASNSNERLKSDAFTAAEITSLGLPLALQTNQELHFDNISAYGYLMKNYSDGKSNLYTFDSRYRSSAPLLNPKDQSHYTQATEFYDFKSPEVASLIDLVRAKNPQTPQDKVAAILGTLNKSVHYDNVMLKNDTIRPLKASEVAKAGKGVCQNFTALFVAVARGLGLPARTVMGTAWAQSSKEPGLFRAVFHAWTEVSLDGKTWTPVEPQFADTIGIPPNYFPLGEMAIYEKTQSGDDLSINDATQAYGLKLEMKHGARYGGGGF